MGNDLHRCGEVLLGLVNMRMFDVMMMEPVTCAGTSAGVLWEKIAFNILAILYVTTGLVLLPSMVMRTFYFWHDADMVRPLRDTIWCWVLVLWSVAFPASLIAGGVGLVVECNMIPVNWNGLIVFSLLPLGIWIVNTWLSAALVGYLQGKK